MRVLIACESSGAVRRAFRSLGHDAWSCDILPADDGAEHHITGDALPVVSGGGWDMVIAHPPCTYLTNSGVCHLHTDPTRWAKLEAGAAFFRAMLDAPAPRVAVENPIMHRYARELVGGVRPTQIVQPWQHGHPESKATGLWLRGLPPLRPTNDVRSQMMALPLRERQRLHWLSPSAERWKLRSATFPGIAAAMADQWGAARDLVAELEDAA